MICIGSNINTFQLKGAPGYRHLYHSVFFESNDTEKLALPFQDISAYPKHPIQSDDLGLPLTTA